MARVVNIDSRMALWQLGRLQRSRARQTPGPGNLDIAPEIVQLEGPARLNEMILRQCVITVEVKPPNIMLQVARDDHAIRSSLQSYQDRHNVVYAVIDSLAVD
jgi:hypothetical protein